MYHKTFKQTIQRGFTLIELLVVIGILGILAAALVATIDPFEQLRKAQDSNLKNMSVEFLNGTIRYYTTHNALPWDAAGASCTTAPLVSVKLSTMTGTGGCIPTLISDGELKSGFVNSTNLASVVVNNPDGDTGSTSDIAVCFQPSSKSQQKDPNTKYDATGKTQPSGTCKKDGGSTSCYWCAK